MGMNPEVRELLCTALESGEYIRGSGVLTQYYQDGTSCDCPLGVLCKLAVKAGVIRPGQFIKGMTDDGSGNLSYTVYYGSRVPKSRFLPQEVSEWAWLDPETGDILLVTDDGTSYVSTLNDEGWTHRQVAQAIREQL
jgi:hypothetical protein